MARHRIADLLANSRLDLLWIRKQLERAGLLIGDDARSGIEKAVVALQGFVDRSAAGHEHVDPDAFHAAKEALDQASIPLHEASIRQSLAEQ
jgi:hypothetical protein